MCRAVPDLITAETSYNKVKLGIIRPVARSGFGVGGGVLFRRRSGRKWTFLCKFCEKWTFLHVFFFGKKVYFRVFKAAFCLQY